MLAVKIVVFAVPVVEFAGGHGFPDFCIFNSRNNQLSVFPNQGLENKISEGRQDQGHYHRAHDDAVVKTGHWYQRHIIKADE